ncbi:MAG: YafY family protein [Vulcanimicrobiaceae bacterium]
MLLLLQGVERRSARELAEALEVSERTVYRDVDALSASGVPIYTERGAQGGIALSEGYRKALTQFNENEIRSLFISASNPLMDLGLAGDRERVLAKLSGAMSDVQRKAAAKARGRIHLDQRRWNQAEQPQKFLALLRRAVWEDRCVELHYRDRDAKISQRALDPLGLVAKAGIWYLVARIGNEHRTFRAERIMDVVLLDQTFERPTDFDLDGYWNTWTSNIEAEGKKFVVILRAAASELQAISRYWETRVITDSQHDRPECVVVRMTFPGKDAAMHSLLSWGNTVEIIDPLEIRADIIARARELLTHHQSP